MFYLLYFSHFYLFLRRNTYLLHANSVEPDQMPQTAASDQGLHRLPMSYFGGIWHSWVNIYKFLEEM